MRPVLIAFADGGSLTANSLQVMRSSFQLLDGYRLPEFPWFGRWRRDLYRILLVFGPAVTGQQTALDGVRGNPSGGSMRPYLILCVVVLLAVAAFGQQPVPGPYGCFYGCGPFIPRLTTPEISLQQFSPNPVGATNATTGLIAGATNSTLSQIQGSTSSVYTVAVWYEGGAPLISPQVHLWPETVGREGRVVREAAHEAMFEQRPLEAAPREGRVREARSREDRSEDREARAEVRGDWTFFAGPPQKAGHVYGNDDVTRQNDKNGAVKYGGKTEKM